jgi:cellulose synthase/poly-beta-1,6-N-acetylglucosamine synthase-like glycosyltransferase
MQVIALLTWLSLCLIGYSYLGYGLLLYGLVRWQRWRRGTRHLVEPEQWPAVTLLVAAYNEADCIQAKLLNSLALDYPRDKLTLLVVTDGSDDETPALVRAFEGVQWLHRPERLGKIAAVARAMETVETPIVVFSDANTLLNPEALRRMVRHFEDPGVGVVAGEKRVQTAAADSASAAGESLYWRYESQLKAWDGEWHSTVGAAGELFAIRRALYQPVAADSIIEDFVMTMGIAARGHRIAYEPGAYALETASMTVAEEMKRKVRISAGAFQAMGRLRQVLRWQTQPKLWVQYVSHRVLRWTLAPLGLGYVLLALPLLAWQTGGIYLWLAMAQGLAYGLAALGWGLEQRQLRIKVLFVPYYFVMMNLSVLKGWWRYRRGQQAVTWEKAQRKAMA